jgi:hypothetical protein
VVWWGIGWWIVHNLLKCKKLFKDKNVKPIEILMTSKKKPLTISINMVIVG